MHQDYLRLGAFLLMSFLSPLSLLRHPENSILYRYFMCCVKLQKYCPCYFYNLTQKNAPLFQKCCIVSNIRFNAKKRNQPLWLVFSFCWVSLKPLPTEEAGGLECDCSQCEEKGARQGRK